MVMVLYQSNRASPEKCRPPKEVPFHHHLHWGQVGPPYLGTLFSLPLCAPHLISFCALGSSLILADSELGLLPLTPLWPWPLSGFATCLAPPQAQCQALPSLWLFSSLSEPSSPIYGLCNTHPTLTSHPEAGLVNKGICEARL